MNQRLVVAPECGFEELARRLAPLRWRRDGTRPFTPDPLPGEPELAGWRRGAARLTYTFNPVVSLRVLDLRDLSAPRARAAPTPAPPRRGGRHGPARSRSAAHPAPGAARRAGPGPRVRGAAGRGPPRPP